MLREVAQAKRFMGIKFGHGEPLQDGVYAIPTTTSRGDAFMRLEISDGKASGQKNFHLFWDEDLKIDWYNTPEKPEGLVESRFATLFRQIEACPIEEAMEHEKFAQKLLNNGYSSLEVCFNVKLKRKGIVKWLEEKGFIEPKTEGFALVVRDFDTVHITGSVEPHNAIIDIASTKVNGLR